MKKVLLFLLAILMCAFATMPLSAQNDESSTLTVYAGNSTSLYVPAYIYYFDDYTRSQFVIPETDLVDMAGGEISSIKFYTNSYNIPYTTESTADVYLKTVDYTTIVAYEAKESATVVYTGTLSVVATENGGELTIEFTAPYTYSGGNLLVGIENTTDVDYKSITFYGQSVNGASIASSSGSSLDDVSVYQRNFIPKTTFTYTGGATCKVPTGLVVSDTTAFTATVSWANHNNASSYNIQYMLASETDWENASSTTSQTNSVEISGLNAFTMYKVRVQADCGQEDGVSQWSSSIQFITQPSCLSPTQIQATNLTSTSAELMWNSRSEETEWVVEYDTAGFTLGTGLSVSVTGNPYFLIGDLEPNTSYDLYVRAVCSATDTSAWSSLYHFVTPCDAATLPLEENFDSYPIWYSPDCWRKYENGNSGYVSFGAYIFNEQPYSGTNALKFVAGYAESGYAFLRLPDLDVDDITELQMSFMAKKNNGSRPLIVGVAPDFNSVDSIYVVATLSDLTSAYVEKIVSFESYPGTSGYIVIGLPKGYANSATYYVDNVKVDARPNCMYPVDVNVVSDGGTSATVSWTELGTAESWNIEYGLADYVLGEGTQETDIDTTFIIVEDLAPATAYDFYVQSNCDGTTSDWVGPYRVVTSRYILAVSTNDTITTCGTMIYDDGGPTGDYSLNYTSTLVIYPATEGSMVMLTGTSSTESNYDFLTIYNGVGADEDSVLVSYSGVANVSALSTVGPLTLKFTSDVSSVRAGFELMASCVSCFPPSNVTVSNSTMEGATISWNGPAAEYAVYAYGPDTTYATVADTTITLTGLQASSIYNVVVRSLCDGDSSFLTSPVLFTTACGAIEVTTTNPWTEGFENYSGTNPIPLICWQTPLTATHDNGTFPAVYKGWESSCHTGSASLEMKANEGQVIMAVLPEFTNSIQDLRLSFWATTTSVNYGLLEVGVLTDPDNVNSFVVLDTASGAGPRNSSDHVSGNGNHIGPFDFNTIGVTEGRIALRYHGANSYGVVSWNLDDIVVQLIPNCPSPEKTIEVPFVDGHTATISFVDHNPDHDAWIVYYKKTNDPETQWMQWPTNETTVTITGLASLTSYIVYVVTDCDVTDEVPDATDPKYFTTLETCSPPANVTVDATATEAVITWMGNADSYTVVCGDFTGTVEGNMVTVTDLSSFSNYTVTITADCGEEGVSTAVTVNFRTACDVVSQFPYIEQFSNTDLGCWINQNIIGENSWHTYSANSVSSPRSVYFDWEENTSSNLISPIFDLSGMTDPYLSFYRRQQSYGAIVDTLVVSYRTSVSSEWVRLAGFNTSTYDFQLDSLALPEPSDSYQLCFTGYGLDAYGIYLDDIKVYNVESAGPVAASVTTNAALNVGAESVTLKGTINNPDGEEIVAAGFKWKAIVNDTYTFVEATVSGNSMTYELTGLTPNTNYTYFAFIVKADNDTVFGNSRNFTTSAVTPTQPTVVTGQPENVTTNSAILKGTINNPGGATIAEHGFRWRAVVGGTYVYVSATVSGNVMSAELTDLDPGTNYRFRAFIVVNADTVFADNATNFQTLEMGDTCATPTGVTPSNITKESITVSWDNADVESWFVQYRPLDGVFTSANTESRSYVITGLTPQTTYEIQVQADCGNGNVSAWATTTATTLADGVNSYLENSVVLYPNPAKEAINVQCTMNEWNGATVEVLDVYGKLLQTLKVDSEITQINVSSLANGMYFVRMTTEQGVVTKRFVKE